MKSSLVVQERTRSSVRASEGREEEEERKTGTLKRPTASLNYAK